MKVYIFFIFVILFLSSCASTGSVKDAQKASAHYQLGVSYLNDNNIQPAFVEFQKAIELNPLDKESHHALGVIYLMKLEDYPKAIKHFQQALNIDKNFSEAATNLGNAYANMRQYNEAIQAYKVAIANPQYKNTAMALNNMGMVYYKISKLDDAISAFKEALKRYSSFPSPYYGLALCYNAKGQYGDAATAIMRAIEFDPFYKGNREKAIEDLKDKRFKAKGEEEKDIIDYLEILNY
jgi:type IV pilus biogenesis/stability protein PilW